VTTLVIGAAGGLGAALLTASGPAAIGLSRSSVPPLDLLSEPSIAAAARHLEKQGIDQIILASGFLHGAGFAPEKAMRQLDPAHLAHAFAVNAIGPALVLKHFLPLLPRDRRVVCAALSARVGSIGDNRLGGWWSYRASKAALNQILRNAAIELARTHPQAILVAIHPGTVATPLSAPFAKSGLPVATPEQAAARILDVLARLRPEDTGGFFDQAGQPVPW
jgi:NAD(P)-dependent dehydrogenase (short-subunit alcohol dehydrogenase family)